MSASGETTSILAIPARVSGEGCRDTDATLAFDTLAADLKVPSGGWIDDMQLAAHLEALGLTDQEAQERYLSTDVFALAARLSRSAEARPTAPRRPPEVGRITRPRHPSATWAHGPVYFLPAVAIPGVLAATDASAGMKTAALVTGGALGWIWCGVSMPLAYRLLGLERERSALRLLMALTGLGLLVSTLAGAVLASVARADPRLIGVVLALSAYQLGTGLAFYLHRRRLVVLSMSLVVVVASVALLTDRNSEWAGGIYALFLISTAALLLAAFGRGAHRIGVVANQPMLGLPLLPPVFVLARLVAFALSSAAFLLLAQAAFLRSSADVAMGLVGLIVSMGVVEWRALALGDRARDLLARHVSLVGFHRELARTLRHELTGVVAVTAAAGTALGIGLERTVGLSSDGIQVITAGAVLAGVYLLAFTLANMTQLGPLTAAFSGAAALNLGAPPLTGMPPATAFLVSALLLLALLHRLARAQPARTYQ